MAAGTLPAVGTEYGPCTNECKHRDCAETRRMAEAACDVCGDAIEYGVRFYQRDPIADWDAPDHKGSRLTDASGQVYVLVHARCVEPAPLNPFEVEALNPSDAR